MYDVQHSFRKLFEAKCYLSYRMPSIMPPGVGNVCFVYGVQHLQYQFT